MVNFQKIGKLCASTGSVYIYTNIETNEQYVGNGKGAYALIGMPFMNKEQICALLGVDSQAIEIVELTDWICSFNNDESGDRPIGNEGGDIFPIGATDAYIFFTEKGALCIDKKYIEPFKMLDKSGNMSLVRRGNYLVVKYGFYFVGAIMPVSVKNTNVVRIYADLLAQLKQAQLIEEASGNV